MSALSLNERSAAIADRLVADAEGFRVAVGEVGGARVIDCGARVPGGLGAGSAFAEACMGGLGTVRVAMMSIEGTRFPGVSVTTDHPLRACLAAQYAGWKLETDGFFAMASGPGRALVRAEPLFDQLDLAETAPVAVFALETRSAPPPAIIARMAERAGLPAAAVTVLFAPTASTAGAVQIAARVVETAMHKLHAVGFAVERVMSGLGSCPLPPVARDDYAAIGRTNDAILYGGSVHLTVGADDAELAALVPRLPASASAHFGRPFAEILDAAGGDFYAIDPLLFSPAEVAVTNVVSGRTFRAGAVAADVLRASFSG